MYVCEGPHTCWARTRCPHMLGKQSVIELHPNPVVILNFYVIILNKYLFDTNFMEMGYFMHINGYPFRG